MWFSTDSFYASKIADAEEKTKQKQAANKLKSS